MAPLVLVSLIMALVGTTAAAPALGPVPSAEMPDITGWDGYTPIEVAYPFEAVNISDISVDDRRRVYAYEGWAWQDWDRQGPSMHIYVLRSSGQGKHIYVGDSWNDRISSIELQKDNFYCQFHHDYDWQRGCYGRYFNLGGSNNRGNLMGINNDAVSCFFCADI